MCASRCVNNCGAPLAAAGAARSLHSGESVCPPRETRERLPGSSSLAPVVESACVQRLLHTHPLGVGRVPCLVGADPVSARRQGEAHGATGAALLRTVALDLYRDAAHGRAGVRHLDDGVALALLGREEESGQDALMPTRERARGWVHEREQVERTERAFAAAWAAYWASSRTAKFAARSTATRTVAKMIPFRRCRTRRCSLNAGAASRSSSGGHAQ